MSLFSYYVRDAVRIAGPDAQKLLNDTLTCRINEDLAGIGRWFALLSPQGKVQVEGLATFADGAYYFDIEAGHVAEFTRRMKMYRLRAKVDIDVGPSVWWSPDGEAPGPTAIAYKDERYPTLGTRYLADTIPEGKPSFAAGSGDPSDEFDSPRVKAGIAEWPDFLANEVFPHDIGMDLLKGIDFVKGCYVGQEVVSRMQHRGTARRRPVTVSGLPTTWTKIGIPLLVGDREVGTLGKVAGGYAVAIVRLDRIQDADAATAGGVPVSLSIPSWATYRFGESAAAE